MLPAPRPSLGQTIYLGVVGGLLLIAVALFAWGQFSAWRAGSWKDRARDAEAAAGTAQANADSANAGASNASATRAATDAATIDLRVITETAARRIEHADPDADSGAGPRVDVVRELEDAAGDYRAAADRLQRKRAR